MPAANAEAMSLHLTAIGHKVAAQLIRKLQSE
jgi:hypothetical protein